MKESRKGSYEKPAVVLEKKLEALAVDCGGGLNNTYLGGDNCKASGQCAVPWS